MTVDFSDRYQVHAYMIVGFWCAKCDQVLDIKSTHEPATDDWCADAARQARAQGWFVARPTEEGAFEEVDCFCPAHAPPLKIPMRPSNEELKPTAAPSSLVV